MFMKRILLLLLVCPCFFSCFHYILPDDNCWVRIILENDLDYSICMETNIPNTFTNVVEGGSFDVLLPGVLEKAYEGYRRYDVLIDEYPEEIQVKRMEDLPKQYTFEKVVKHINEIVPDPYLKIYETTNDEKGKLLGESNIAGCEVSICTDMINTRLLARSPERVFVAFIIKASSLIDNN